MLAVTKIGPESEPLLRNLFEHYAHDMSEWFEFDTQADGSYSFDVSKYCGDEVFLARCDGALAGFAIVGAVDGAHDLREFFVLRRFRRRGIGRELAECIWNAHPGLWVVRVAEANLAAVPFWRKAVQAYARRDYREEAVFEKGRDWRLLRFTSGPR